MKWASSHHLLVVCFQASVLSVVVQLPGPVQVSYFLPILPILTRHFFNSFCANFFAILYVSDDFSLFQVLQHFQCTSLKNQQIVWQKFV